MKTGKEILWKPQHNQGTKLTFYKKNMLGMYSILSYIY